MLLTAHASLAVLYALVPARYAPVRGRSVDPKSLTARLYVRFLFLTHPFLFAYAQLSMSEIRTHLNLTFAAMGR